MSITSNFRGKNLSNDLAVLDSPVEALISHCKSSCKAWRSPWDVCGFWQWDDYEDGHSLGQSYMDALIL